MGRAGHSRSRGNDGYALIFALGVMLVILIIGLRFLAVVHSRQQCTDNDKSALQAALIADAGVERIARELSQDMGWSGTYTNQPLAGGTYTATVSGQGSGYVQVQAQGTYGGVTHTRTARVYTPAASGQTILWPHYYGTGALEWNDKDRLVDRTDGENDTFASHKLGEGADQMSVGQFGSDIRSATITKVEIVISGYVDKPPGDDYLTATWYLADSGTTGQWRTLPTASLAGHIWLMNRGRMYVDVTAYPPAGGWRWVHFYHGTDLELRFASYRVGGDDGVKLYVDCAGFRITWGP